MHSLGAARAAELLLLGEPFTAEQAAQWGLVRAVVPAEQVLDAALELARTLAAGPTLAYAEIKKALALGAVSPLDEVLAAEGAAQARLGPHQGPRRRGRGVPGQAAPHLRGRLMTCAPRTPAPTAVRANGTFARTYCANGPFAAGRARQPGAT